MAGADDPDYDLLIAAEDSAARYSLTFGSMLRGGNLYQSPDLDRPINGRVKGGVATVEPDEDHRWKADGPITLLNNGSGRLILSFDHGNGRSFAVPPQGSIDTSCPTERKRILALSVVGGGLATAAGGAALDHLGR